MARPIKLTKEQFADLGEGSGYSGWYYTLDLGTVLYRVRRYQDSADEASFMSFRRRDATADQEFDRVPSDPDFQRAARHLWENLSISRLKVLTSSGYQNVPIRA